MKPVHRLKDYIAIILIGIFIFPIAFQPVHVVLHQSPGSGCENQCCHIEATVSNGQAEMSIETPDDGHCPICEYQFAVKDLPEDFLLRTFTPVMQCSLEELVRDLTHPQPKSIKTPRAPPACIS